ncbi:MAG TPA: ATP-binding protein [Chloroflexota bacterium]
MILVFFIYGLAFFAMGFAIALESRPFSDLRLARYLPYLAAFGILHSTVEWADMLLLIESASPPTIDMDYVRMFRTVMLGVSTGALVQFGAGLLFNRLGRSRWLLAVPGVLGLAWIASLFLLASLFDWGSRQWLVHADVWARYLLYLPGSILAGLGLVGQARQLDGTEHREVARDARFASATFLLNALVSGLVVPPGQQFPSTIFNSDLFQTAFGVPVQILRAGSALAIAFFILRLLRIFRMQTARQMEEANRRQIEAQQEALEIQKRSREEIEQWNRELEDRIASRTAEITLRNRQLLAVNSIAAAVSQSFDLGEILEVTLHRSQEALDAEVGGAVLFSRGSGEPSTQFSHGLPEEFMKTIAQNRLDAVMNGRLDSYGEAALQAGSPSGAASDETPRWFLIAPMKAKGQVLGAICVARSSGSGFDAEDARLLTAIGHQVAIAVENARLFGQVQNMATLEERERLAREMHDGLAQVLGFLGIKTRVVQQQLASGRFQQVEKDLSQIQGIVQDAYADVRQSIVSLRTAGELEKGLLKAIEESATDFSEQNSIPVEVALAEEGEVCFPPEAEVQLVRIVQEALANVRKHARASKVWIRLVRDGSDAVLTVEDDGIGFDQGEIVQKKRRSFGLETMRERAESIGALLEVSSVPGEGTRIQVRFPFERGRKEPERVPEGAAG